MGGMPKCVRGKHMWDISVSGSVTYASARGREAAVLANTATPTNTPTADAVSPPPSPPPAPTTGTPHMVTSFRVEAVDGAAPYVARTNVYLHFGGKRMKCWKSGVAGQFSCPVEGIRVLSVGQNVGLEIDVAPDGNGDWSFGGSERAWKVYLGTTYIRKQLVDFSVSDMPAACARPIEMSPLTRVCGSDVPTYWFDARLGGVAGGAPETVMGFEVMVDGMGTVPRITTSASSGNGAGGVLGGPMYASALTAGDMLWAKVVGSDTRWRRCMMTMGQFMCPHSVMLRGDAVKTRVLLRFSFDTSAGHHPLAINVGWPSTALPATLAESWRWGVVDSLPSRDSMACGGTNVESYMNALDVERLRPVCGSMRSGWRVNVRARGVTEADAMFKGANYGLTRVELYSSAGSLVDGDMDSVVGDLTAMSTGVYVRYGGDWYGCTAYGGSMKAVCVVNGARVGTMLEPTMLEVSLPRAVGVTNLKVKVVSGGYGSAWVMRSVDTMGVAPECAVTPEPARTVVAEALAPSIGMCDPTPIVGHGKMCVATEHGQMCEVGAMCSPGWVGTPAGGYECLYGEWHRNASGCTPMATAKVCAAYTAPEGIETNCTAGGHDESTVCEAMCSAGYSGKPRGSVRCVDGNWYGTFKGCDSMCTLPESVCVPGVGVKPRFEVKVPSGLARTYAEEVDTATCGLPYLNGRGMVKVECADGYGEEGGVTRPAKCVGGFLVGGWTTSEPVCVKRSVEDYDDNCGCGGPHIPTRVRSGLVRKTAPTSPKGIWDCSFLDRVYTCSCKCKN